MSKSGQYTKEARVAMTEQMYQFLHLMAERNKTSISDLVRQAIREHLDIQEDIITSRSRLGRTVMRRLDIMHSQLLDQLTHLTKLMLAATIVNLAEQGHNAGDISKRILSLASQPAMDRLLTRKVKAEDQAPR